MLLADSCKLLAVPPLIIGQEVVIDQSHQVVGVFWCLQSKPGGLVPMPKAPSATPRDLAQHPLKKRRLHANTTSAVRYAIYFYPKPTKSLNCYVEKALYAILIFTWRVYISQAPCIQQTKPNQANTKTYALMSSCQHPPLRYTATS